VSVEYTNEEAVCSSVKYTGILIKGIRMLNKAAPNR
jgi:hypothetical protein